MAVFRVERTRDYTVMSNYHLKDTGLTLKAKGLLSMMLSLPDEWNYTTRGLASICKESVETIGSLNVFNHRTNVELTNRLVCFNIKELGKQLKQLGMLVIQDQVWNRVTVNRAAGKTTRYYCDEFHLLLKGELASWSVEIWKRFRKWGGIPTGITQNIKDLLASREIENIFENSDFIYMLNQASGDRQILAKQLNISPHQLSYVTHSGEGEGLLFYGNVILPFLDRFPKDTELYRIMTTKPQEVSA